MSDAPAPRKEARNAQQEAKKAEPMNFRDFHDSKMYFMSMVVYAMDRLQEKAPDITANDVKTIDDALKQLEKHRQGEKKKERCACRTIVIVIAIVAVLVAYFKTPAIVAWYGGGDSVSVV